MEVARADKPKPVVIEDEAGKQIKRNISSFKDPFENLRDAKIRRMTLTQEQLLYMIYDRLGQIGRVLEDLNEKLPPV